MKAIILSLPLPTLIIQITHLWVITHRLGTTVLCEEMPETVNEQSKIEENMYERSEFVMDIL